jgi:g-D-glutamyl-meso-diaminopimelate peptidase
VENTTQRGAESCIGDYPFSEAESSSLRDFTLFVQPKVTLSWHTKGEEIYWEFMGLGDRRGADILANATGYKVKQITGSSGGYKDWCLQKCGIAAYTIECGANHLNHPILKLSELAPCFDALSYFTENYF